MGAMHTRASARVVCNPLLVIRCWSVEWFQPSCVLPGAPLPARASDQPPRPDVLANLVVKSLEAMAVKNLTSLLYGQAIRHLVYV